jgi:hypothetical protein
MVRKPKKKPARRRMPSDRRLRAWIFDRLCDSTNAPAQAIADMETYLAWIKHGTRPGLRVVKGAGDSATQDTRANP